MSNLTAAELEVLTRWALGGQTSQPARTIAAVAMGLDEAWFDFPRSGRDFASCAKLLREVPALEGILPRVASLSPGWRPIVAAWDELTRLHNQDRQEAPRYERIRPAPGWLAERVLVNRRACHDQLQALLPACNKAAKRPAETARPASELPTVSMPDTSHETAGANRFLHRPLVPTRP